MTRGRKVAPRTGTDVRAADEVVSAVFNGGRMSGRERVVVFRADEVVVAQMEKLVGERAARFVEQRVEFRVPSPVIVGKRCSLVIIDDEVTL